MKILIVILILWSIFSTFVSVTALLAGKMNYDNIEAIKSWYPFCELMKIRISKDKGGDDIDEGMAWMPMPEPYKAESEDEE